MLPPPPQTSGALRKAKRESDTACICRIGAPSLARSSEFVSTKPQAHHLYVSLGEEHETNHLEVDIKLKEDVQSVYNISKNPHGAALGRRFFSHLIISLTKDLTKSIRVQLDTACTCNTIPEKLLSHWFLLGRSSKTVSPLVSNLYSPMTTVSS